jgi:hypothetical protein
MKKLLVMLMVGLLVGCGAQSVEEDPTSCETAYNFTVSEKTTYVNEVVDGYVLVVKKQDGMVLLLTLPKALYDTVEVGVEYSFTLAKVDDSYKDVRLAPVIVTAVDEPMAGNGCKY